MTIAPAAPGFERLEAYFSGHGFDPHRHDTFAMGVTVCGVQSFRYRGEMRRSLPGQVFVLHPDEVHDGRAGTREGFGYRTLYLEPRLIRAALDDRFESLPFLPGAVSDDPRLKAAVRAAFEEFATPPDQLHLDEMIAEIADALAANAGTVRVGVTAVDRRAAEIAREFIESSLQIGVRSAQLERVTGLSRFAVARHFRACFATSPYRYLVFRRLDRARRLILGGETLAAAAAASGFADQSHMTRHFRRAYGLSPGRWAAAALGRTGPRTDRRADRPDRHR